MKPFNLKAALAGSPVVTRDGKPVKIVAYEPEASPGSHLIFRLDEPGSAVRTCHESGLYFRGGKSDLDLFMMLVKKTVWVNAYPNGTCGPAWYESQEEADKGASYHRLGGRAYPIEVEV